MSESTNEQETPEQGLISDEQLPDDLRPDTNPMARDPDDSEGGATGPAGPQSGDADQGAPDAG